MAVLTSKDGTKIAFEKTGRGPAIIIVNGALSHRNLYGDRQLVSMLSEHFTVYTYDRRGRGESTDVQPYAVEREIEDIDVLINSADGSAYLYGISSGAALALQTAARLGSSRVPKLALYEPPYTLENPGFDKQKQDINEIIRTGQPGDAATFFMSELGTPPEILKNLKKSPEWEAIKKIDFTLSYDYSVLGDGMIPYNILKAISAPTLVMDGENTMDFMHATADRIAELIPNAQRKTLKAQTHEVEANVLAPVLIEFFKTTK